jgi:hypothetical protein
MTDRLRAVLPVLLLAAVAVRQIHLVRTADLPPWKGGGFGMFSTTDGLADRRLRIVVTGPGRAEQIEVPPRLLKIAAKAALLPDEARLEGLARAIAADEREAGRPVETIDIEVLTTRYAPKTLYAEERSLARHHHRATAAPEAGGDAG